jgi:DNA-directed RNA polymerase III subunit RPC1
MHFSLIGYLEFISISFDACSKQISFGLMPPTEIVNCAEFHVFERALYKMPERRPQPNGVLDPRLGVSNKRATCETCGQQLADCTGHFGYIALELPVFHIGYFRNTLQILQCICKSCARVLLNDDERRVFAKKFRNGRLERIRREALFRRVLDRCKRVRNCPHCGDLNGPVKKAPSSLKVIHDPFYKKEPEATAWRESELTNAADANEAIKQHLKNAVDDLNPLRVQGLFRAIPDEDCELLDLAGRPENLLLTHIPVPPVCIRPSVEMDGGAGSNEDDLTVKLMQIVEVNNILRHGLERGLPISNVAENWDFLQVQCAVYINSDLPGVTSIYQVPGKPTRGFVQRLKGKQGRFRGNLSGKRVDFSGRTVISPNPHLSVEEVGLPRLMAMTLTYPERVTDSNLEKLKGRVLAGAQQHPGANFVIYPGEPGDKVFLKFGDRKRIAEELKVGDIVERHLEDDDIVLFNRQPSLHRMSIMCHRVRVLEGRTLRFNECVCAPYNADFDGDEMNIHVPQTEEARAEARELMGVRHNLATPKSGEILIAATQDFLTASFLLTSKDVFLTRPQICLLASYFLEINKNNPGASVIDLPAPAIFKPIELWTGKQAFSLLLRPRKTTQVFVTLETKERQYGMGNGTGKKKDDLHMDDSDGYVCFRNSELLSGRLGKGTLGGGNKSGLFQVLSADYGPGEAVQAMNRLAKLSARMIGEIGFSIGIDDVTPAPALEAEKASAVDQGYAKCEDYITSFNEGRLELAPGCDAEESLENSVTGELNSIRERAAAACMAGLHRNNSPLIMSQCGSKGSPINIAQMVACVGQQSVGGQRVPNGFRGRALPHFPRGDRTPEGKGFVANSFYSGLTPTEFFFHTMAGREGLVDTAVKTAETGYMSRRLMKALEDLYVHYDSSVRNAAGGIVQLRYGEDGMDPVGMEGKKGEPVAFDRLLSLARGRWHQVASVSGRSGDGIGITSGGAKQGAPSGSGTAPTTGKGRGRKTAAAATTSKAAAPEPAAMEIEIDEDALLPEELRVEAQSVVDSHFVISPTDVTTAPATTTAVVAKEKAKKKRNIVGDSDSDDDAPAAEEAKLPTKAGLIPCSEKFREELLNYVNNVANDVATTRQALGLPHDARAEHHLERLLGPIGLTRRQLADFVELCSGRHRDKVVDPGSTVGAFGAQSIGEPGTQMTLKTFHFAGVASMNITLGVPRIKEIINAARNIATPVMRVALEGGSKGAAAVAGGRAGLGMTTQQAEDEVRARLVKGRLEKTTLGQVAKKIRIVFSGYKAGIEIELDPEVISRLQLELKAEDVRFKLMEASRLKLKPEKIRVINSTRIQLDPPDKEKEKDKEKDEKEKKISKSVDVVLQQLISALPDVVVHGIPSVPRSIISRGQKDDGEENGLMLYVEGTGMLDVMGTLGVDGTKVKNNNIMEVAKHLGIEAARATIIGQIEYTMEQHGMTIDSRHTMLLADCMTNKGEVLGITRFGIAKMKDSVLMLASFEKTTDHLFDAALHGRVDDVTGVSECIIMGIPMPVGTGLFKLMQQPNKVEGEGGVKALPKRPAPLLAAF